MGSLRNPVGPLPSSIYWRRRAVLLSVVVLLALLVTWVMTMGGGGEGGHDDGADGKNPAPSITPGPSGSGPAISQAPGGRDESGDGDSGGTGSGGEDGSGDGSDAGSDDGSAGGSGSGAGESGGSGDAGGASGSGSGTGDGTTAGVGSDDVLPAGTSLPACTAGAVELSLRSVRNTYEPGQTPAFELTARNGSGSDCAVDLGPEHAVVTITQAGDDDAFWSSDDCVKGAGSLVFRVPAGAGITYTIEWDRKPSAPECATPESGKAKAGTYLVEAKAPGFDKEQTSFVLESA